MRGNHAVPPKKRVLLLLLFGAQTLRRYPVPFRPMRTIPLAPQATEGNAAAFGAA